MKAEAAIFSCVSCGECCRHLDRAPVYAFLDRGDGTCKYLVGDACAVYPLRPLLCRVAESYPLFSARLDRETYLRLNAEHCRAFQRLRAKRKAREREDVSRASLRRKP